ncbi:MAG: hypothetical protein JNM84_08810 [Planctomycetes bacterium]|nr:hypothetical protein [Planctomycetota bacterium]
MAMSSTVRCISLSRHWHGHARLDLWHAEAKKCWWIELHLGPRRISQSPGYAELGLAQEEFERQKQTLPAWYADVVEKLDEQTQQESE